MTCSDLCCVQKYAEVGDQTGADALAPLGWADTERDETCIALWCALRQSQTHQGAVLVGGDPQQFALELAPRSRTWCQGGIGEGREGGEGGFCELEDPLVVNGGAVCWRWAGAGQGAPLAGPGGVCRWGWRV